MSSMKKSNICAVLMTLAALASSAWPQSTNSKLFINEFMASNVLAVENAAGEYEDWIEIYNAENFPVDLAGYYLTDDPQAASYWKIPSGLAGVTTVPARGFLLLHADGRPNPAIRSIIPWTARTRTKIHPSTPRPFR